MNSKETSIEEGDGPENPEVSFGLTMTHTFPILALSGFVDTLRHAADDDNRNRQVYCRWAICGPDKSPIMSSAGIKLYPDIVFDELKDPDFFVIVGGLMPYIDQVPPVTMKYLRDYYNRGGTVVGLCTASFILAQAGLLENKKAVVHHRHRRDFLERYQNVQVSSRDIFVEDNRIITSPGGTASIDLAMSLLSRKLGRQRALKGLVEMSIDRIRAPTEMALTPLTQFDNCSDQRIRMAIQLMRDNLSKSLEIAQVADSIGISTSQLSLIFVQKTNMSPAKFRRFLQLEHARWLLLNSDKNVTQIAMDTGFSDQAHFSNVFSKKYGTSPKKFKSRKVGGINMNGWN